MCLDDHAWTGDDSWAGVSHHQSSGRRKVEGRRKRGILSSRRRELRSRAGLVGLVALAARHWPLALCLCALGVVAGVVLEAPRVAKPGPGQCLALLGFVFCSFELSVARFPASSIERL